MTEKYKIYLSDDTKSRLINDAEFFEFTKKDKSVNLNSFRLAADTLAFGYILPTTGRIRDFHPLETCAARRTAKLPTYIRREFNPNYYLGLES